MFRRVKVSFLKEKMIFTGFVFILIYRKSPFFSSLKNFVTETLDESFSSKNFSHLKFFFTVEFQNKILKKIFHNENLIAKFKRMKN